MARRNHHHVYVVELSDDVLLNARFMRLNPDCQPGKRCIYVGMTELDPDLWFDKHTYALIEVNQTFSRFAEKFRIAPKQFSLKFNLHRLAPTAPAIRRTTLPRPIQKHETPSEL